MVIQKNARRGGGEIAVQVLHTACDRNNWPVTILSRKAFIHVCLLQDEQLQEALEDLRARYKAVCAMLNLQPSAEQKSAPLNFMDF